MKRLGSRAPGAQPPGAGAAGIAARKLAAVQQAGDGKDPWWVICEHDAAYTTQAKTRPTPEAREDDRPVRVVGPIATEQEADEMAAAHYGRTLRGWAEASRKETK